MPAWRCCHHALLQQLQQRRNASWKVLDEGAVLRVLRDAARRGARADDAMSRSFQGRPNQKLVARVVRDQSIGLAMASDFFRWAGTQPGFRHDVLTYTCLLQSLVRAGQLHRAYHFFRSELCANCAPNRVTYTVIIQGFCNHGCTLEAMELLREMKRAKVWPDVNTYNVLLQGLCNKGLVGRAMTRFGIMVRHCKPDIVTYNTLIKGMCKNDRLDWAIFLFQRMIGEDAGITMSRHGDWSILNSGHLFTPLPHDLIEPDTFTYSSLIHGLCKDRRFDDGVALFEYMLRRYHHPDTAVFNSLANGLCTGGRLKDALRVLERMLQLGIQPDIVTYTCIIAGACRKRKIEEGYALFKEVLSKSSSSSSEGSITPNVIAFNTMVTGLSKQGRVSDCESLLELMRKRGLHPDEYTYSALMSARVRAGDVDGAKEALHVAMSEHVRPDVCMYTTLVKGYSRAGRLKEAQFVLDEMRRRGRECAPNIRAYNLMLEGFCDHGRIGDAVDLFQQMVAAACYPNRRTFQIILGGIVRSGQTDKFRPVFMDMVYKGRFARAGPVLPHSP